MGFDPDAGHHGFHRAPVIEQRREGRPTFSFIRLPSSSRQTPPVNIAVTNGEAWLLNRVSFRNHRHNQ